MLKCHNTKKYEKKKKVQYHTTEKNQICYIAFPPTKNKKKNIQLSLSQQPLLWAFCPADHQTSVHQLPAGG